MAVTRCVGKFSKRLQNAAVDRQVWRDEIQKLPEQCPEQDCSPGGCQQHCRDFARVAWFKAADNQRSAKAQRGRK